MSAEERDGPHSVIMPATSPGLFVAVVGPSGAGKDSVINGARTRFAVNPNVVFARRIITRLADGSELHDTLSEPMFQRAIQNNEFAMWWQANGLHYGLSAHIHDDIDAGRTVIANLSREKVAAARAVFQRCAVIHINASPDVLIARLAQRGRESGLEQAARLQRIGASVKADVVIMNNGALDVAIDAFEHAINRLREGGDV